MKRSDLPDLLSALLILMFTYAAVSKLLAFSSFRIQMLIQPVPRWTVTPLIYLLPSAELLISISLLFKPTRQIGLYSAAILMLLFTIYVGLAMIGFYGKTPCTCGGILNHLTWPQHFAFNLIFLSVSIYGIIIDHQERRFIGR